MKTWIEKILQYLKETRAELRKVAWPDQRYVTVATTIILILVVLTGLYVMGIDLIFTRIFGALLK